MLHFLKPESVCDRSESIIGFGKGEPFQGKAYKLAWVSCEWSKNKMGETYITMKVHGPNGSEELGNVLVDTGATFTKIPLDYAQRIGIIPEYEVEVELGDGRKSKRQIGYARVEIQGIEA